MIGLLLWACPSVPVDLLTVSFNQRAFHNRFSTTPAAVDSAGLLPPKRWPLFFFLVIVPPISVFRRPLAMASTSDVGRPEAAVLRLCLLFVYLSVLPIWRCCPVAVMLTRGR